MCGSFHLILDIFFCDDIVVHRPDFLARARCNAPVLQDTDCFFYHSGQKIQHAGTEFYASLQIERLRTEDDDFRDLAANAVEAIHHKGTISITMRRSVTEDLILEVQNTGSSIPLRRLGQIFRPGYTTKYDSNGRASSGVGLTYIKTLAESLGGSITAASDGESQVLFKIILPLARISPQNEMTPPVTTKIDPINKKGFSP